MQMTLLFFQPGILFENKQLEPHTIKSTAKPWFYTKLFAIVLSNLAGHLQSFRFCSSFFHI